MTGPGGTNDLKVAAEGKARGGPAPAPAGDGYARPALYIVAATALVAAMYFGRAFLIPLLLGAMGSIALHPVVSALVRLRVPRALGAAMVVGGVAGGLSWAVVSLGEEVGTMVERLPEAARKVRQKVLAAPAASAPLRKVQEAAKELERAASEATGHAAAPAAGRGRAAAEPPPATYGPGLQRYLLEQSTLVLNIAAGAPVTFLLMYFLLVSSQRLRTKLLRLFGRSLNHKESALAVLQELDYQIQRYLLVVVITNVLIGIGTWLAFAALGLNNAVLWGIAAGVLHFMPYLGPALIAFAAAVAAFLQFDSVEQAFYVAAAALAVATLIGMAFQTWLQSRYAKVNAAILFIGLLFFGWLWGPWGLLLAGPLLAIAKVTCDHIEPLRGVGELLGP